MGRRKQAPPAPQPQPEEESQEPPEEDEQPVDQEEEQEEYNEPEAPATGRAVKKADMVRAALAEGLDAPGDIADFIQRRYGVEIPKQRVSSYKAQQKARERKNQGEQPQGRRAAASAPAAKPAAKPAPSVDGGLISDIAAIKHLVERLGVDQVKQLAELFE